MDEKQQDPLRQILEEGAKHLRQDQVCERCKGTGKVDHGRIEVRCPWCDGSGIKPQNIVKQ